MRRILLGLVFFFGALFIYNYFSELESVLEVARQGAWQFFGLAIGADIEQGLAAFERVGQKLGLLN